MTSPTDPPAPWYATERVEMLVIVRSEDDLESITEEMLAIGTALSPDSRGPVDLSSLSEPGPALLLRCLRVDFETRTDDILPLLIALRQRWGERIRVIMETKTVAEAQTNPITRFLVDGASDS